MPGLREGKRVVITRLREYWFYCLLPVWALAAWQISVAPEALAAPLSTERVFLFDFGIFLPVLYFVYLRKRVGAKAAALRSAGIAAAGLALAAWLMPAGEGQVLPWLAWLRWTALPAIIVVELAALVAITRYVYSDRADERQLVEKGMPPIVAKLMLAEARFWKRVWAALSGRRD